MLPTIIILTVIFALVSFAAGLWTDILWFESVGFSRVFTTQLFTRSALFVVGFLLTAGLVMGSLVVAYRTRPLFIPSTPAQQTLAQYRDAIEPLRRLATLAIPLVIGALGGSSAASHWRTFLLWNNAVPFGRTDPHFGMDLSFFVFTLPWLSFVLQFLFLVLVVSALAAAFTHYVYGGLQLPGRGPSTRAAFTHLGILGALIVLVRGGQYWLDRYALSTHDTRLMTGINYTDANAVLPTKAILAVAAAMCAGMFLVAIWTRSWRLPVVGVATLIALSILVGGIYPQAIQSLRVRPSEKSLESKYLGRNIEATRAAYGLSDVEVVPYRARTDLTKGQLREDADTVPGIRLVDPIVVAPTFRQLQALRSYYVFPDALDVDRYTIDGKAQDTVIAVRELDLNGVPQGQRNWLNDHTVYTHGFGVVAAYGNQRGEEGQPVFYQQDIPPRGPLGSFEPRIYFGELSPQYSIVGGAQGSTPREFDYPDNSSAGQKNYTYTGNGGVSLGNFARKAAYAVKYRELKFLLSDAVGEGSRLMDHRTPLDRVERVAPWLTLDGNPYPVVVDGRVKWVVDGYTTSAHMPYSRLVDLDDATSDSTTERARAVSAIGAGEVNYIRNSVKATVDAFDGSVHLYAWDTDDPVLKAWTKAFPDTIEPLSQMSGDLMAHMRYPEDLFKVQRLILSRYHVTEADSFYGGQDYWRVPRDPSQAERDVDQPPYYLSIALPGQDKPSFSLTTTFMPAGTREVLSGFLSVDADAGSTEGQRRPEYGKLRLLELPRDSQVRGPGQVQNDINSSNVGSAAFTLTLSQFINNNSQGGSRVTFGNLLTLPVGEGLLYVQPIYVRGSATSAYPLSRATVAAFGDRLAWSETLDGALDELFGGNSGASAGDAGGGAGTGGTPTPGPTPAPGGGPGDNAALAKALADIQAAYEDGQEALRKGDFAAYGAAQKRLEDAIAAAIEAQPSGGSVTVTPSPGASPTAGATGTGTATGAATGASTPSPSTTP